MRPHTVLTVPPTSFPARPSSVRLRYVNSRGAEPRGRSVQLGPTATHLGKIASRVGAGVRDSIAIYGDDYDTPDGTCVRDYIHVSDLAAAHLAALEHLDKGGESCSQNCGSGHGYSCREELRAVERCTGRTLNRGRAEERRGGKECVRDGSTRWAASLQKTK